MRHTQSHRRLLLALALVATGALSLAQAKTMNSDEQQVAAKQDQAIKQLTKQTDSQSSQSPLQQQQQLVAEKKQGDQAVDSLFNSEEYVQIKPEDINVNGGLGSGFSLGAVGKEVDSAVLALSDLPSSQQSSSAGPQVAEHKSAADDELSAHLAHDTISTLESGVRPYAAPLPQAADPRAARPHHQQARDGYMPPRHPQAGPGYGRPGPRRPYGPPQPPPPPGYIREPRSPARYPPPPQYSQPAGYMSLKGKITDGISSMVVSHPPRPSQTYGGSQQPSPPQAPRYLPRGAAAGYAAFREFVRAQANRYKGQQQPQSMSSHEPVAYNAAMPQQAPLAAGYGSAPGQVSAGESYRPNSNKAPVAYVPEATGPKDPMPAPEPVYIGPSAPRQQVKNKITVAQAYIPHLTQGSSSSAFTQAYGSQQQQQQQQGAQSVSYATNPLLAKLYGGHAPQGVGRPEYNKDYGMVIHYPQATVYTEPMTVDQLHKLAGSSISQILEQLQHNLATGHRDEANTIRANNKHQLGHGLTIHAKEFYAPGKSGNYVPTTAAVISTKPAEDSYQVPPSSSGYSSEMPALVRPNYGGGSQNGEMAASGLKPELGSGYERVKATVAASAMKYGQGSARLQQQQYGPQQVGPRPAYGPEQSSGPAPSLMKPYEPLGAIANIIGSELESLYNKANSVLSKQIDPEFHAHVQAHLKSLSKVASPLKLSEHDYMSPLVLQPHGGQGAQPSNGYGPPPPPPPSYHGPVRPQYQQRPGRGPRRPSGGHPQGGYPRPAGNRYPTAPPGARPYSQPRPQRHPHKNNNYQQQQPSNYNSAEQQAFQQQMNQLLNDFNLGEDNYGAKSQPTQAANQGYPNKVMQKYQQQQQLAGQHPLSYEHVDGLEIPQGPNDQIGEISELIDALKGSLETHKPDQVGGAHSQQPAGARDQGKMEDVRYLASALGQVPSYAIQVPVGPQQQHPPQQYTQPQPQQQYQSGERAVYEAVKKGQEQEQHQQQQYSAPQQQPKQQQYAQPAPQALPQQAAPQAYQQQQPAPAAHAQPLPYNAPPAQTHQGAYDQTPVDVPSAYSQQHQPVDYAQQPQAGSHGQYQQQQEAIAAPQQQQNHQQQQQSLYGQAVEAYSSQLDSYANQQQHHHQQQHQQQQQSAADAYGKAVANNRQQAEPLSAPASYAKSGPASAGANSYQQQQASPAAATIEQNQQQPSYSTSEHSQVINHLVPVQQQQQHQPAASSVSASASSSANDYNNIQKPQPLAAITSSISHQPHNQISVAAPTESQYQSAQPLSSFVESLPSDYQELLRQPAGHASILDGASSGHSESYASGASAPKDIIKTAASSSSVSAEVKPVASHHRSSKHDSHHLSGSASSISSTYQQVPSASATSTSSKSAGASSSPSASSSSTSSASSSLAAGRSSSASHPEKK